jgi:hypothetical protein
VISRKKPYFVCMALQPKSGLDRFFEVPRSHTNTHPAGLLWTSDELSQRSALTQHTTIKTPSAVPAWHTNNLGYDQSSYDPHAGQGHLSYDSHGGRKLQSEPRYACLLISIKMAPKKLKNNFLVSTVGKLLVLLVNYAYYATLFHYEKVR